MVEETRGATEHDTDDDALWEDRKDCQMMALVTQGLVTDGKQS
jgi:hypothetical protein